MSHYKLETILLYIYHHIKLYMAMAERSLGLWVTNQKNFKE